jgi:hypothetical protein
MFYHNALDSNNRAKPLRLAAVWPPSEELLESFEFITTFAWLKTFKLKTI